jgi:hypothetical protein
MKIRAGYEISYDCPQPTPMILTLSVYPSRTPNLLSWDRMLINPAIPVSTYHDSFGNFCHVIRAPAGRLTMSTGFPDSGQWRTGRDHPSGGAARSREPAGRRPDLSPWQPLLRDRSPVGYGLVPVRTGSERVAARASDLRLRARSHHDRLAARQPDQNSMGCLHRAARRVSGLCPSRRHLLPLHERPGTLLQGYLGDIGVPPDPAPMDFSAWFEAYLAGRWYTFDARHNTPRIGRILMARGRDATDVAIVTSFGPCTLAGFEVITDEVTAPVHRT